MIRSMRCPMPVMRLISLPVWWLLLPLLALLISGCTALPPAQPGPPSKALKASNDTTLGRIALAAAPDPDLSGFRLMPGGDFALSARLELARRAERQLDVQYYHIENDATGRHFLRALRDAARRGVRVRLLMDDLYTSGEDELLLGLAATPNFELRLYNPFRSGRNGGLLRRLRLRRSSSTGCSVACTTSSSSRMAPSPWPVAATSAGATTARAAARIFWISTPSLPARCCHDLACCSISSGTANTSFRSSRWREATCRTRC